MAWIGCRFPSTFGGGEENRARVDDVSAAAAAFSEDLRRDVSEWWFGWRFFTFSVAHHLFLMHRKRHTMDHAQTWKESTIQKQKRCNILNFGGFPAIMGKKLGTRYLLLGATENGKSTKYDGYFFFPFPPIPLTVLLLLTRIIGTCTSGGGVLHTKQLQIKSSAPLGAPFAFSFRFPGQLEVEEHSQLVSHEVLDRKERHALCIAGECGGEGWLSIASEEASFNCFFGPFFVFLFFVYLERKRSLGCEGDHS